jgi:PAS domain S-box-containing protein
MCYRPPMTSKDQRAGNAAELRLRAEAIAREQAARSPKDLQAPSPEEARLALHELRVHQVELEMQNDELRRAQAELVAARARYFDLYDLAPVGYCTLSEPGLILEANLAAATLLGMARGNLVTQRLSRFILKEDEGLYYRHRKRLFDADEPQAFELRMVRSDGTVFWAHLEAAAAQDAGGAPVCRVTLSDNPDRKRAADALRQAEERLELFFSQSLDGFFFMMLDEPVHWNPAADKERLLDYVFAHQRVTKINDPMLAQYGSTREQFTGLTPNDMFAHDIPYGRRVWREFFDAGRLHIDTEERRFDGTRMWVEGDYICMYDTAGRITGHFGIQREITERKRVEEALRESEARFKTMFEESPLGIALIDSLTGHIYAVNPMFARIAGRTMEEMAQIDWMSITHPDDVQEDLDNMALLNAGKIPGFQMEKRYLHHDGTPVWINMTIAPILVEDKAHPRHLCMIEDITDRKRVEEALRESENSLRALFDSSPIGIEMYDATGRLVRANAACLTLFGLASEDPIKGFDLFADPNLTEALKAAILRGEDVSYQGPFDFERVRELSLYPTTRRGIIELDVMIQPLSGGRGYQVNVLDITERKRAEEKHDALHAQLLQAQKADSLGRMAGAIAHHYNNLLGAVLLNLELAQSKLPSDAGARKYLADATKVSQRAAEISQQMLAYLGQERGRRVPSDLCETCREVLPLLRAALPRNARLRTEFPGEGAIIRADALQMKRVLTYLAANAGEAIGDGGGSVAVAIDVIPAADIHAPRFFPAGWEPKAETYVCLSVADTGCGMTPEILDKAFDPFFSTKFTGRGLGLPVVMGIVMAHEGACAVETSPGQGTTCRVFLPVIAERPVQLRKAEPVEARAVEGRSLVLVVDDEPMLRNSTRSILRLLGYEVLEAADGAEAVEVFRQHHDRIRCVLCDLTMPRLDGWATLKALRSIRPDVAVILTSGYDEAQVMAGEQPERPQAFLQKPYASADLKAALAAALKER